MQLLYKFDMERLSTAHYVPSSLSRYLLHFRGPTLKFFSIQFNHISTKLKKATYICCIDSCDIPNYTPHSPPG